MYMQLDFSLGYKIEDAVKGFNRDVFGINLKKTRVFLEAEFKNR